MNKNQRFVYLVEGECEEKLLRVFRERGGMITDGKVMVFNAANRKLVPARINNFPRDTIWILIFDTDRGSTDILRGNISLLKKSGAREVWCIPQVTNLEDELKRATDVKEIKELTGSKSNADYKRDFINDKSLLKHLSAHRFDFDKFWETKDDGRFSSIGNDSGKIKLKRKKK